MNTGVNSKIVYGALALALVASSAIALRYREEALKADSRVRAAEEKLNAVHVARATEHAVAPAPDTNTVVEVATSAVLSATGDLQRVVLDLEARIREKDAMIANFLAAATNAPARTNSPWRGREDWLETMKKEDPARYEEIVKRRDEARKQMENAFAKKAAYLLNQDTSKRSEEEQAEHARLLALLDETWKAAEQLRTEGLPDDQRRALRQTMRENTQQLSPLLEAERNREFYELGVRFGYNDAEAVSLVEYINEVIDLTSMRNVFQGMRGGGNWGGPPPGGGPQR